MKTNVMLNEHEFYVLWSMYLCICICMYVCMLFDKCIMVLGAKIVSGMHDSQHMYVCMYVWQMHRGLRGRNCEWNAWFLAFFWFAFPSKFCCMYVGGTLKRGVGLVPWVIHYMICVLFVLLLDLVCDPYVFFIM